MFGLAQGIVLTSRRCGQAPRKFRLIMSGRPGARRRRFPALAGSGSASPPPRPARALA
ncbi:hypothetical protein HMPREF0321_2932 [Dermacoccus sp. Ellin185]|nr:hypothetical protein HMPREF0321_2932 [Dermacoccus sp. Ellin185]